MKQRLSFIGLLACGVVLSMISTANAQVPSQGAATVVRVKGSARYTVGNNVWEPLNVGTVLRPGTVIQTGLDSGSYVDLALNNAGESVVLPRPSRATTSSLTAATALPYKPAAQQNTVRAFENTILGLDKLTAMETGAETVTETQLDLKSGRILGSVKKLSPASKYEVKLANGVAGVRGTVFQAIAEGIVQVVSGSVVAAWVADGAAKTQVVMAGEELDMRTGQIRRLNQEVNSQIEGVVGQVTAGAGQAVAYTSDRTVIMISPTAGNHSTGD